MKIINTIMGKFTFKKTPKWEDIEYFDTQWKKRIKEMSKFISPNESILDLGCGHEWLKEYLDKSNTYFGVDYKKRSKSTLVRDFNNREFTDFFVDTIFISGCLEYIIDFQWFIQNSCKFSNKVILSYCCIETHDNLKLRKELTWVNNLSYENIVREFEENNFIMYSSFLTDTSNRIFIFKKLLK